MHKRNKMGEVTSDCPFAPFVCCMFQLENPETDFGYIWKFVYIPLCGQFEPYDAVSIYSVEF
jgi:hypothetical protein